MVNRKFPLTKYQLVDMITQGLTQGQIAKKYRYSRQQIFIKIKEFEINYIELRKEFKSKQIAEIKKFAIMGMTVKQIAKNLNVDRGRVDYLAKTNNIEITKKLYYRNEN